ncbi:SagB family peptide dehydrogenase [Paenibacillus paridis]|uniref:SagB family peptide dehydrogenase n=1 Tax=Paenibacillus paridis TaxID=2583376 RepID=UPI0011225BAE|nr:SagB family peptide dehydrogenase [Paenibacillus paridis]
MSLKVFLHQLQFDPDKTRLGERETDWEDAPLTYKLYRGQPIYPLSADIPLALGTGERAAVSLQDMGHFLWYAFGLTQLSQSFDDAREGEEWGSPLLHCRRFVPSGGGLYPSELYLYLKMEGLPFGVYHYDAAHHRLILLREGNFDDYVSESLGRRCAISACFGVVFVSTVFWKNYFKYFNFSYRLQGLDAGLLIGQMTEAAKAIDAETGVYFQFLDRSVNHLLGLTASKESVYAVIPLHANAERNDNWFIQTAIEKGHSASADLVAMLAPAEHESYMRSQRVLPYPMLLEANRASIMESSRLFRTVKAEVALTGLGEGISLPALESRSIDFDSACRNRYSPENDFVLRPVSLIDLAALLQKTFGETRHRNDLDEGHHNRAARIALYGCFYGVEGLSNGAYLYDDSANELRMVRPGDHRLQLQEGLSLANVNMHQVPLCFHIAGDIDYFRAQLGYRGYRIQQMEAGMLVQRLLLAASDIGMAGRPLLGFDASGSNALYDMIQRNQTCLIQIPIGYCRMRPRLEGSLSR